MHLASTQAETLIALPSHDRSFERSSTVFNYGSRQTHENSSPPNPVTTIYKAYPSADRVQRDVSRPSQTLPGIRELLNPEPSAHHESRVTTYPSTVSNVPDIAKVQPSSRDERSAIETEYQPRWPARTSISDPSSGHSRHSFSDDSTRRYDQYLPERMPQASLPGQPLPPSPFSPFSDHSRSSIDTRRDSFHQISRTPTAVSHSLRSYAVGAVSDPSYARPASSAGRPLPTGSSGAIHDPSRGYLHTRDVPGEGTFHFYNDGSRIPARVDGEAVNPVWGLTKANKPRKRLAMACLDCREKKIKCEPGQNSCIQCEKAKRPCRKSQNTEPISSIPSPASWSKGTSPARRGMSSVSNILSHPDDSPESHLKRRSRASPRSPVLSVKKPRSTSPSVRSDRGSIYSATNGYAPPGSETARQPNSIVLGPDPFSQESTLTDRAFRLFLSHINGSDYRIFPPRHISHWFGGQWRKTETESMVLHAALAAGSNFEAEDQTMSAFGSAHAEAAIQALQRLGSKPCLAAVQTQFFLTLYHISKQGPTVAANHIVNTISAALSLHYHTERGCDLTAEDRTTQYSDFRLNYHQAVECRRRTMWSCFLLDRYHGTSVSLINHQDIFLRLPCADEVYEQGHESTSPCFANVLDDPAEIPLTRSSPVSSMAWLVSIAAIWAEIRSFIHRSKHQTSPRYAASYERFYASMKAVLQSWMDRLPSELHFSPENLPYAVRSSSLGPLVALHILHHYCLLKLNRCLKHAVHKEVVARNIRAAHSHAYSILQIIYTLHPPAHDFNESPSSHPATFSRASPFLGRATYSAVDVVSAGEWEENFNTALESIKSVLPFLYHLGTFWQGSNGAQEQFKACEKRYHELMAIRSRPHKSHAGCWLERKWGVLEPMEKDLDPADDVIYGVENNDYYAVMHKDAIAAAAGTASAAPPNAATAPNFVSSTASSTAVVMTPQHMR